jgi:hypothetical protein
LAEFAITLPILLILVFGVIEFGRVFQAWVTLQNAARTAARYASTGRFNETKYVINENRESDPDSIVHCTLNADNRGTLTTLTVPGETVQVYNGDEGLFATYFDGENCEPNRIDHQDLRKDIARILSITDEARRGAAGLALGPDPLRDVDTQDEVRAWLYKQWERPLPGGGNFLFHEGWDQPGYFDVMICSSRAPRYDTSSSYDPTFGTRFITILNPEDVTGPNGNRAPVCVLNEQPPSGSGSTQNAGIPWLDPGGPGDAVTVVITFNHPLITPLGLAPYIPLQARRAAVNEAFRAAEATGALQGGAAITADINLPPVAVLRINNPGVLQPGNRIVVPNGTVEWPVLLSGANSRDDDGTIVEYVFTLNLAGGATLELYRGPDAVPNPETAINVPADTNPPKPGKRFYFVPGTYEVFLTVRDNEGGEATTSIVFTVQVPDPTNTPTNTPRPTSTVTPIPPFSCDLITAGSVSFFNNRVYIQIDNQNMLSTVMTRANFRWRKIGAFPNMYVAGLSLNGLLHWRGQDYEPSTDTNADVPTPADVFLASDRTVRGQDTSTWEAVFSNGPAPIQNPSAGVYWMTQHDFAGTTFEFLNPEGGPNCVITLNLPTPTPSPTVNTALATNTPTWTPDCAGNQVDIRFDSFQTFGTVRLVVTNRRVVPATFTDFSINWVKRGQLLERIVAGGQSAADLTNGTLVWESGSANQDSEPPTVGGSGAASSNAVNNFSSGSTGREGIWRTNYSFPPNSVTNLWIKFGVTASTPNTAWGMVPSDLNGTWFQIGCGTPPTSTGGTGGTGGGGTWYGGDGRITIFNEPSPFPSVTPRNTNTPQPTFTPSMTFTPRPTNTPVTATITHTPTNTHTPLPVIPTTEVPPDDGGNQCGADGNFC